MIFLEPTTERQIHSEGRPRRLSNTVMRQNAQIHSPQLSGTGANKAVVVSQLHPQTESTPHQSPSCHEQARHEAYKRKKRTL